MRTEDVIEQLIEQHRETPGALLPLLHAIQERVGYVPAECVGSIAAGLSLSRAEVHGVISFYHDFRSAPAGRHVLQICRAEACQAMGSRELEEHARRTLGIEFGQTSADGAITLEPVYCLGNCACSPSIRIDNTIHARVDAGRFDALLSALSDAEPT